VCLGTDGVASNDNLDLLQEVDMAAKLQSYKYGPGILKAKDMVSILTIEGAQALGLADKIGSLEIGKAADIIAVDLDKVHATPRSDPYSHLVYSATGADVKHTMVNGKLLMQNYHLTELDESAIIKQARTLGKKIRAK